MTQRPITRSAFQLLIVCLFVFRQATAQELERPDLELPECDIYLFDLSHDQNGFAIANGQNVTDREGYDNQPWFTPDSQSFLFTANCVPDRTDVFEYFIESGETKQVTDSPDQSTRLKFLPTTKRFPL
jgi:Tol biopolymer transport system component